MNKLLIVGISLVLVISCSYSKTNPSPTSEPKVNNMTNDSSFYFIGYIFDPVNKTIKKEQHFSRIEKTGGFLVFFSETINYWGTEIVDAFDNPNNVNLYFAENYISLSESTNTRAKKKDKPFLIEGYKYINGLYENEGIFYDLINLHPLELIEYKIPNEIGFANLKNVDGEYDINIKGTYYYDNDGLYFFSYYPDKSIKKIASGKGSIPLMHGFYCEYEGKVYQNADLIGALNKLTILDMKNNDEYVYLTDGNKLFPNKYLNESKEITGLNNCIPLTNGHKISVVGDSAYVSYIMDNAHNNHTLFQKTDGGSVVLDWTLRKDPIKIKDVFIHYKNDFETLEQAKYQLHTYGFYTYKGQLFYEGMNLRNKFDAPNIKWLKGTNKWISDGKLLTHDDLLNTLEINDIYGYIVEFDCVPIADIKNLRVISDELLTDGINFYQFRGKKEKIEVIPLNKFWFDIVIDLTKKAY